VCNYGLATWPRKRGGVWAIVLPCGPVSNSVGIRELRQQASAILKRVVAGEAIVVTEHGHPIARIVPLRPSPLEQLMIEGRATEAEGNLIDVLDEMGLPAEPTGNILPSAALAELRADER
jgi:prevent-host-death family protein